MLTTRIRNGLLNAYSGIPRNMWLLAIAMFINRCGSMVLLFMSVYLTKHFHYSIPEAGTVMGLFGAGSLAGAFMGGRLVDRIGFYPILYWSMLLSGTSILLLGQMHNLTCIGLCTFLTTFTGDAFRPANSASISTYSTPENYSRCIALNRLSMNLGFAIGPVVGGWLATMNYTWLFWTDGLSSVLAALFIIRFLPPVLHHKKKKKNKEPTTAANTGTHANRNPYRDRFYLFFLLCTTIYATSFFQFFYSLPLYYKNVYHLAEKKIGFIMAFNGLGVAAMEMFLIYALQKRGRPYRFIAIGNLLLVIAYLLFLPFHHIGILYLSMLFLTLSEMFAMPLMGTLAISHASASHMGQYMALYSMSWSLAQIIAPLFGAAIIHQYGFDMLWIGLSVLALLSFSGFSWLHTRRISQTS